MSKISELIANVRNYDWFPTKEYSSQFSVEELENKEFLEALKERIEKKALGRFIQQEKEGKLRTWRNSCKIEKNRIVITYGMDNFLAFDFYEREVPPEATIYGSLWNDMKFYDKNPTKKNPDPRAWIKCSTCYDEGRDGCYCCGEGEPPCER